MSKRTLYRFKARTARNADWHETGSMTIEEARQRYGAGNFELLEVVDERRDQADVSDMWPGPAAPPKIE